MGHLIVFWRALQDLCAAIGNAEAVTEWASAGIVRDTRALDAESLIGAGSFSHDKLVMEIAGTMLQIATPEAVLDAKDRLPAELMQAYLNNQEHFDLPNVLLNTTPRGGSAADAAGDARGTAADTVRGVDLKSTIDLALYRCVCCA